MVSLAQVASSDQCAEGDETPWESGGSRIFDSLIDRFLVRSQGGRLARPTAGPSRNHQADGSRSPSAQGSSVLARFSGRWVPPSFGKVGPRPLEQPRLDRKFQSTELKMPLGSLAKISWTKWGRRCAPPARRATEAYSRSTSRERNVAGGDAAAADLPTFWC